MPPASLLSSANFIFLFARVVRMYRNSEAGRGNIVGGATTVNIPMKGMNGNRTVVPSGFAAADSEYRSRPVVV